MMPTFREHVEALEARRLVALRKWGHVQRLTTPQRVDPPQQRVPPVSHITPHKDTK